MLSLVTLIVMLSGITRSAIVMSVLNLWGHCAHRNYTNCR
jgi:hypothetical protein